MPIAKVDGVEVEFEPVRRDVEERINSYRSRRGSFAGATLAAE